MTKKNKKKKQQYTGQDNQLLRDIASIKTSLTKLDNTVENDVKELKNLIKEVRQNIGQVLNELQNLEKKIEKLEEELKRGKSEKRGSIKDKIKKILGMKN